MSCLLTEEARLQKRINSRINRELQRDYKESKREIKLLLLGEPSLSLCVCVGLSFCGNRFIQYSWCVGCLMEHIKYTDKLVCSLHCRCLVRACSELVPVCVGCACGACRDVRTH